jgi:SAM-dependent methyltransferase
MKSYIQEYKSIFEGGKFIRKGQEITLKDYAAFDGGGIRSLIDTILAIIADKKSVTILDFGCGTAIHWHKHTLVNKTKSLMTVLGEKVQGFYRYDPAVDIYSKKPTTKFDLVVCSDVLEHIPDSELQSFIDEASSYVDTGGTLMFSVSTSPSNNSFLSGENMHINIKSPDEWVQLLKKYSTTKISVLFNGKYSY